MAKRRIPIFVSTPQGRRHHGDVVGDVFVRDVDWETDRMKIFDAWSIHPDALDDLEKFGIKKLLYRMDDRTFEMTVKKARKKGFTKEFAGGVTIYLQLKHWTMMPRPLPWQCSRCETRNTASDKVCTMCYLAKPPQQELRVLVDDEETGSEKPQEHLL